MPELHALLSASGSHKWLHCTPSARLEETCPETTSEYAEEGRLAHAIAELQLTKQFTPVKPSKYKADLKNLQENPRYNPEMMTHVQTYIDFILGVVHSYESPPYVAIEKTVDYGHVAPGGFGTADCILIGGKTMHVIDLKYGKGVPVYAENNTQMMLYALGSLAAYEFLFEIEEVTLSIIQPRLDAISSWTISVLDLLVWAESIRPIAQLAFDGIGETCPGDWCRFCKVRSLCRARSEFSQETFETYNGMKPPIIGNDEVGEILKRADVIKKWISDIEEYALSALLAGEDIPGWKAVEGRAVRQFTDAEAAFEAVKANGYDEVLLYERKPISLASVEKLLSKKAFTELLGDFIFTPPGKPTLAAASDKRPAITGRTSAADEFGGDADA